MPLRPEVKKFYGPEWQDYRKLLIETHGTICTKCLRDVPKYFNFAHLHEADLIHDHRNDVAGMCASCHSRYDTPQRVAMTRRTWARRHGQLWLTVELEFAPYPESFWPRRAMVARQLELFE